MDARIKHSMRAIQSAFLEILKEEKLPKVNVTEICRKANVNRATFYKYYSSPEDLLSKLEDIRLEELTKKILDGKPLSLMELTTIVIDDVIENFEFYTLLFGEDGTIDFRKKFTLNFHDMYMKFLVEYFPSTTQERRELLYSFLMTGCIGSFTVWYGRGMQESPETVKSFILSIMEQLHDFGRTYS